MATMTQTSQNVKAERTLRIITSIPQLGYAVAQVTDPRTNNNGMYCVALVPGRPAYRVTKANGHAYTVECGAVTTCRMDDGTLCPDHAARGHIRPCRHAALVEKLVSCGKV